LQKPIAVAKESLQTNEKLIAQHIKYTQEGDTQKEIKQIALLEEIKQIEDVLKRCSL